MQRQRRGPQWRSGGQRHGVAVRPHTLAPTLAGDVKTGRVHVFRTCTIPPPSAAFWHTTSTCEVSVLRESRKTELPTAATIDAQPRVLTRSLGCGSGASNAPSNAAPAANRVIRHGSADVERRCHHHHRGPRQHAGTYRSHTATSPNEAGIDHFEAFGNRSRHPDGAILTCVRPGRVEGKRGRRQCKILPRQGI